MRETITIRVVTKPMKHTWSAGAKVNAYTRMIKDCGRKEIVKNVTDAIRKEEAISMSQTIF